MSETDGLQPLKITWNITDRCHYRCAVCATHDSSRRQLTLAQRRAALRGIYSSGVPVAELDFAGGDPLFDADSREVIREAIAIFGWQTVCVTTTGYGIEHLSEADKPLFLAHCELTVDTSQLPGSLRDEPDYSVSNYAAIMRNLKYFKRLTVNVPIIDWAMPDDEAARLIALINDIPIFKTVSLLRLMPVGRMSLKNYPRDYDPARLIALFSEKLENAELHLQCALRGRYAGQNDNCGMVRRKLGIDCAGNLFGCAWCGYNGNAPIDNPYFLGNIGERPFADILADSAAARVGNAGANSRGGCVLFSGFGGLGCEGGKQSVR